MSRIFFSLFFLVRTFFYDIRRIFLCRVSHSSYKRIVLIQGPTLFQFKFSGMTAVVSSSLSSNIPKHSVKQIYTTTTLILKTPETEQTEDAQKTAI